MLPGWKRGWASERGAGALSFVLPWMAASPGTVSQYVWKACRCSATELHTTSTLVPYLFFAEPRSIRNFKIKAGGELTGMESIQWITV